MRIALVINNKAVQLLFVRGVMDIPRNSPPDVIYEINYYICNVLPAHSKLLFCGAVNAPSTGCNKPICGTPYSATTNALLEMTYYHNLVQLVKTPTRVHGSSSSLLDLWFINGKFPLDSCSCEVVPGISDHDMVIFTMHIKN